MKLEDCKHSPFGLSHSTPFGLSHSTPFGLSHSTRFGLSHPTPFGLSHPSPFGLSLSKPLRKPQPVRAEPVEAQREHHAVTLRHGAFDKLSPLLRANGCCCQGERMFHVPWDARSAVEQLR